MTQSPAEESTIRILPAVDARVESGPVQFGDDWPGVFIRGDNAGWYAMQLAQVLDGEAAASLGMLDLLTLRGLQSTLAGAVVGPAAAMVQRSEHAFDGLPESGEYFRHVDGGLYRRKGEARYTEDTQPLVVYEHLWPFERGDWARPKDQWTLERFAPIDLTQVRIAIQGDRLQAQAQVNESKRLRREAAKPSGQ